MTPELAAAAGFVLAMLVAGLLVGAFVRLSK